MKLFRKFLCWLLGHRSICLHRHFYERPDYTTSSGTGWKCERCETTFTEGWDE